MASEILSGDADRLTIESNALKPAVSRDASPLGKTRPRSDTRRRGAQSNRTRMSAMRSFQSRIGGWRATLVDNTNYSFAIALR